MALSFPDPASDTGHRSMTRFGASEYAPPMPKLTTERLVTARLDLDPLRLTDAEEMVGVLADPALYTLTGGLPPSLDELRVRFERQVVGQSPDGHEAWVNFILKLRPAGPAIGFLQATIEADNVAEIAWLVGVPWQGRGYAVEAARRLVTWLADRGVRTVTAHIHSDHAASGAVARRVGLQPTDEFEGGERIWRST